MKQIALRARTLMRWAAGLLALTVIPAHACYSGLVVIPTTETVGANSYSINLQADGPAAHPAAEAYILNTQIGIGDRFETGIDFDLSEGATTVAFWNAKYLLATYRGGAVAVGVCNVGRELESSPYLVATRELGALRVHAGAMRLDGTYEWFVGADRAVNEQLTLMADYTSGEESCATLGIYCQLSSQTGVLLGALFPNGDGDTWLTLQLELCGSYRANGV